jgi:hypothetical protein
MAARGRNAGDDATTSAANSLTEGFATTDRPSLLIAGTITYTRTMHLWYDLTTGCDVGSAAGALQLRSRAKRTPPANTSLMFASIIAQDSN